MALEEAKNYLISLVYVSLMLSNIFWEFQVPSWTATFSVGCVLKGYLLYGLRSHELQDRMRLKGKITMHLH